LGKDVPVNTLLASALLMALTATPALAGAREGTPAQPAASAPSEDLPMTPRFAAAVTAYRNCVMEAVDAGSLADHHEMASAAMAACAIARGQMASQLASDIRQQHPGFTPVTADTSAASAVDQIEPMIEDAAIERAHAKYAQSMI
jgi:hypothetical protein